MRAAQRTARVQLLRPRRRTCCAVRAAPRRYATASQLCRAVTPPRHRTAASPRRRSAASLRCNADAPHLTKRLASRLSWSLRDSPQRGPLAVGRARGLVRDGGGGADCAIATAGRLDGGARPSLGRRLLLQRRDRRVVLGTSGRRYLCAGSRRRCASSHCCCAGSRPRFSGDSSGSGSANAASAGRSPAASRRANAGCRARRACRRRRACAHLANAA